MIFQMLCWFLYFASILYIYCCIIVIFYFKCWHSFSHLNHHEVFCFIVKRYFQFWKKEFNLHMSKYNSGTKISYICFIRYICVKHRKRGEIKKGQKFCNFCKFCPIVWREDRNYSNKYYFCLLSVKGINESIQS